MKLAVYIGASYRYIVSEVRLEHRFKHLQVLSCSCKSLYDGDSYTNGPFHESPDP